MSARSGGALALALLLAAGVTNYVDRVALSVANPMIRAELHLTLGQMGWLLSAFVWAYAAAQLPAGALVDRLGPRRALGGAMLAWSAAQAAAGWASGLGSLASARALLGVGEAPHFPAGARVVRGWFAERRQGLAVGAFNTASTLGPALAPPLVTALMLSLGWRAAFQLLGAAGLAIAGLWWTLYREPPRAAADGPRSRAAWARLATSPTLWAMAIGNFGSGFMNWFYAAWLPGYFELQRQLSVAKTGWAAAVPFGFGVLGSLAGGALCDALGGRGLGPIGSRKAVVVGGLVAGALFTGLAILVRTDGEAIAAISAAVLFSNLAGAGVWALAVAAAPPEGVGTVGAVQNFGGLIGGAVAPILTGLTVQATGSFATAQATTAAIGFAGALVYAFGVSRPVVAAADRAKSAT